MRVDCRDPDFAAWGTRVFDVDTGEEITHVVWCDEEGGMLERLVLGDECPDDWPSYEAPREWRKGRFRIVLPDEDVPFFRDGQP